jgi:DNA-binding protein H-NS
MTPVRANIVGPPSSTRGNDLKSMSVDELWKLHEAVTVELAEKLQSEKNGIKQRLRQLHEADNVSGSYRARRPSNR